MEGQVDGGVETLEEYSSRGCHRACGAVGIGCRVRGTSWWKLPDKKKFLEGEADFFPKIMTITGQRVMTVSRIQK